VVTLEEVRRDRHLVNSKTSRNLKSYKTAAIFFSISGILFIIVGAIGGNVTFITIGIALVIISITFWQYSKKLTNS